MGAAAPEAHPRDRLRRELRLGDATLLVVSGVIGSGIFLTPAAIAGQLPQPAAILLAWLCGGLLSLAGALANAELGAMYPRAGGDYVYLREAFHPLAGFLVGWLSFFAIYAGTIATLAAGFAAALDAFLPLGRTGRLGVAVGLTWAVSAVNFAGVRWGAFANNLTALAKLAGLLAFASFGLWLGTGDWSHLRPSAGGAAGLSLRGFGLALAPVLFSYLGWNSAVYVASEIRDPSRNVPRSLFIGVALCTTLYLLVNAVYLYALPIAALREAPNAGEAAARALFGAGAAWIAAALVLASILGTLNAMVLVGPRIAYAMALDRLFLRSVDRAHPRFHTPSSAILIQAGVATGLLLALESFERALEYTTFAILLATMADVAALYRLRHSQPRRPRPYRAWGYPWAPGLYFVANGVVAAVLLSARPRECAVSLGLLALGLPFYRLFTRRREG